jgi:hypothetical protein
LRLQRHQADVEASASLGGAAQHLQRTDGIELVQSIEDGNVDEQLEKSLSAPI